MLERDTIYGEHLDPTALHPVALEIMQHPLFERLKLIHQSGFRIGSHNRWEHSRGVALLANHLHQDYLGFSKAELIAAALLHDIGHFAFSHTAEMAFPGEIDHKRWGIEIIKGDATLNEIFQKYAIDVNKVVALAFEKSAGNPFTVPRNSQRMCIDHVDNGLRDAGNGDPAMRLDDDQTRALVNGLNITPNGVLTFQANAVEIARVATTISLHQNLEVIYSPRSMLIDHLTLCLMQNAKKHGYIDSEDLQKTDAHILRKIANQPNLDPETNWLLYMLINQNSPQSPLQIAQGVNHLVQHSTAELKGRKSEAGAHVVKRDYIVQATVAEKLLADDELSAQIAAARQRIIGVHNIDIEELKQRTHFHQTTDLTALVRSLPAALQAA